MNAPGLTALIAPYSLGEFLANNWPHTPFVLHGLDKTIAPLKQLPFLHSREALGTAKAGAGLRMTYRQRCILSAA